MPRRLLPLALLAAGCLDADTDRTGLKNVPVDTTKAPVAPAEMAARVDQVGRQLVGTSPFLGFEPTFHTLGHPEPEICHPDSGGLFVSAGIITRCKDDAELAAVLATELAIMKEERRLIDRPRRLEPMTTAPEGGPGGGVGSDLNLVGAQALADKKLGSRPARPPAAKPLDRRAVAAELLTNAGYDPKALDAVEPLLAEAATTHKASATFGGRAGKPRWSN
jgi:predicted Zn-dependent protease